MESPKITIHVVEKFAQNHHQNCKPKITGPIQTPIEKETEEEREGRETGRKKRPCRPTTTQTQLTHCCWPITTSIRYPLHSKTTVQTTNSPQMTQNTTKFPIGSIDQIHNTKKRPFLFYLTLGSN